MTAAAVMRKKQPSRYGAFTMAENKETTKVEKPAKADKPAKKANKPVMFGSAQHTAWGQKQGGSAKPTKAEIMKIRDPIERQNKIAQNIELFR